MIDKLGDKNRKPLRFVARRPILQDDILGVRTSNLFRRAT
jgi:hypothetical protein